MVDIVEVGTIEAENAAKDKVTELSEVEVTVVGEDT